MAANKAVPQSQSSNEKKTGKKISILILGKNGICHPLAWKFNKSANVEKIYVQSRNAGTAMLQSPGSQDRAPQDKIRILTGTAETKLEDIPGLAKSIKIDLVVPAHSSYFLSDDLQEKLREAKIAYFGPGKEAAMIETSKSFAKDLMHKHEIPTPRGGTCSNYEEAFHVCVTHLDKEARLIDGPGQGSRIVIKGDGKDALFPETMQDAIQMFGQFLPKSESREKNQVVYEELLHGKEISVLSFSDGKMHLTLPYAQIQKDAQNGDLRVKTKGMGCVAPIRFCPEADGNIKKIIHKTFEALKKKGTPFVGILQTNIIITEEGPKVLGYKANFGETEAQALLPLLTWDTNLEEIMMACVEGRLLTSCKNPKCKPRKIKTKVDDRQSAVVVLAAPAFPQDFRTNLPIYINRLSQSTSKYIIYFLLQLAKSKVDVLAELKEGDLPGEHYNFYLDAVSTSEPSQERPTMESTGGRIMAVSAQAKTIEGALERAYGIARQIEFGYDVNNEPYYRSDIGI